jgi:hypothetical protein
VKYVDGLIFEEDKKNLVCVDKFEWFDFLTGNQRGKNNISR